MDDIPRKLTLLDVAKKAGVSRSLASLAMRGAPGVQSEKRALILKVAQEMNYIPDPAARNLASNATRTLGVLVSDILNPFSASLARSVNETARAKGFDVLLSIEGTPDSAAEKAIDGLIAQRVAGLVLIGSPDSVDMIDRLSRRVPIVYVGRQLSNERVDCVSNDDHLGTSMLVRHLVEMGHRDVVHIDGGPSAGSRGRREAFVAAMEEHGLRPRVIQGRHTLDGGSAAAQEALRLRPVPTAIFASNDVAAMGVVSQILRSGLRVPEDVAVVGYDDMPFAGSETLALTTMRQPIDRMAAQSIDLLLARMRSLRESAVHLLIVPTLVVRRSTIGRCVGKPGSHQTTPTGPAVGVDRRASGPAGSDHSRDP